MIAVDHAFHPPKRLLNRIGAIALAAAAVVTAGVVLAPDRTWPAVLTIGLFLTGMGLAGVFFVALQYATGSGWSIVVRRVGEALAALLGTGAVVMVVALFAAPRLYCWWGGAVDGEPLRGFKAAWLSPAFFVVRAIVYFALWLAFAAAIVRESRLQDADADPAHSRRNVRLSIAFIAVFAFTVWLASSDWIMSLDPDWSSTIFGVYNFAGLFSGGLAALVVFVVWLRRLGPRGVGPLHAVVTQEHLHDLGKLLFAFSTFWMYIWFSQYMLIWYANIPEEASYFAVRLHGLWQPLVILDVVLNWVVPFLALLPRAAKRNPGVLAKVALAVLVGRWLDLYLMVTPHFQPGAPVFGVWELAAAVLAASVAVLAVLRTLTRAPMVPIGDPLLAESLRHHQ
ncbi:MAG: hypothetical protein KA072_10500 [Thermoanaerobaculaceae bacterium]|nr:hypothetical protein [Thermoanaerobaculaceae bacterium]MDI9620962.1 hypothetical protein [Acidobacteriota bacterium]HPW56413.1 hypothetical protein [Thermoanaerobaculaceae bacterium]